MHSYHFGSKPFEEVQFNFKYSTTSRGLALDQTAKGMKHSRAKEGSRALETGFFMLFFLRWLPSFSTINKSKLEDSQKGIWQPEFVLTQEFLG